ncbi:TPA: UDP-forming cellulose synthase catalytic subunit [Klebsiella pneumoniae]|nr:UDP-forming cellulose synthase catalytic subunit [Klebsiella pneumoniae]
MKKSLFWLLALVLSPVAVLVVITPMDSQKQYIFGLLSIGILFLMGFSKRRSVSVIMVVTSLLMSTRYMYFRLTQTLHFNSSIEAILGMGLFLAEVYIWVMLLLNYLQTVWPLKRGIVPLPDDMSKWPTVDIYIPSYNEPLEVVRDTVLAAQCIDYPKDKMKIYLLDDGKRSEFAVFAADVGVGYITRNDNKHAKAGNLNHALTLTQGELICVFDCDHVATRVFLQATVGGFLKDPMLALVQTPHYFYSPDPFERNLSVGRNIPNEGMLFYGPIQQGNDNWNATFFCGSCAVIRREALAQIGGFAVETVTEDAHTALKFQRLGWKSAFLDIPLAAGLATERLVVHVIQRTRWARGMTQIFRVDNPLFGRGLTFQQRLCYLSAMLYYQFALPRVVFVTAPLAYLLFNLNIIYSSASLIVSYALPHLFLAIYVGSRMNGRYRYSFWGEIYDIVLAFHLVLPTLVTMIFPKRGKFNVTDKGGLLDVGYFDFTVVRPHLVVACLLALGVIVGIVRAIGHDYFGSDPNVIALNVGWGIYSLIFLLAAIAVARETRQVRKTIRIDVDIPVVIHYASGIVSRSHTADLSMGGCRVVAPDNRHLEDDIEEIELILQSGAISIPAQLVTFAELKTYEQQLQSSGLVPDAITVALNLPPDLYLLRANGIDMDLKYRYTMPPVKDSSRMDISLNDQFLQSFSLNSSQDVNKLILRLPVLQGLLDGKSEVTIPALRLGAVNQLRFDFQYMNPMPGGSIDNCITFQPVQNHVVIGDDSTIDFSKYYHFIALPDLRVFANAGFPYSRMADLSDTLVVVPKAPTQGQVATLLQALGGIGSQTGLAAINLQMTDDGNQIKNKDADLLLIGAIPSSLKDDTKINLLVEATKSWVKMPMRHYDLASIYPDDEARTPNTRTDITSSGPMAAVIGFQSPYNDQRSVVALLADSPRGNELLTNALNDSGKRAAMFGSVAVIRESGVNSLRVGDIYYVGHLPWFERIWFALSNHPILLAIFAAISIVLLAWVLWRMLRIISRRRLSLDDE